MKRWGLVWFGCLLWLAGLDSSTVVAQGRGGSFASSRNSPFQNQNRGGGPITSNYLALVQAQAQQQQEAQKRQTPGLVYPRANPAPVTNGVTTTSGAGFMTYAGYFNRFGLINAGTTIRHQGSPIRFAHRRKR
jgi:hypothetical protein